MGDRPASEAVAIPSGRVARGRITAPPSKSHAIRALICAALVVLQEGEGNGAVRLTLARSPLPADVAAAAGALSALGWNVAVGPDAIRVGPYVRPRAGTAPVADVAGSGTALRCIAALSLVVGHPFTVTGNDQLRSRPAGAIVTALRDLGLEVVCASGPGGASRPPLAIAPGSASRSLRVEVDASESSQTVSALLLVGPVDGLEVVVRGGLASKPYVDLTVSTIRRFGGDVLETDRRWDCVPTGYRNVSARSEYAVEGDWSSAAFLLAAGAATGGVVAVDGLDADSVQADRRIVSILREFEEGRVSRPVGNARVSRPVGDGRVSRPVDVDLRDAPDLAPLVGALACLVPGTSRVRGAAHLRIKETDRIAAVVRCARALGCDARELPDGFEVTGPAKHGADIDPQGDHRLAMAFAVAGLAVPGVRILDPGCVAKSYPQFWDDLASLVGGLDAAPPAT